MTGDIEIRVCSEVLALLGDVEADPTRTAKAESAAKSAEAAAKEVADTLAAEKASAKAIKSKIADWKAWWEALPPDRGPAEIPKLHSEISRLAVQLAGVEAQIANLTAMMAMHDGVAMVMRTRADAISALGPEADLTIRAQLASFLESAPPSEPGGRRKGTTRSDASTSESAAKPENRRKPRKTPNRAIASGDSKP
jgi:hypothetical protein